MKLQKRLRHQGAGAGEQVRRRVDKKQHGRHERGQGGGQLGRLLRADSTRAGGIQHKTDGVDAGRHGRLHVLGARQAAHFDAGAC